MLLSQEIAHKIKMAKLFSFEHVNKTGKWLSFKLHKIHADKKKFLFAQVGSVTTNSEKIKKIITDYYSNLFSNCPKMLSTIFEYIQGINFPKLDVHQRQFTKAPLTPMELNDSICNQKTGKTPGTDGIPAEFYLKIIHNIADNLKNLFVSILDGSDLPDFWKFSPLL